MARRRRTRLSFPPGPKPWPIIGNILDMTTDRPWERFAEWSRIYGSDVIYVDLPIRPIVILGSVKAAVDLLEKRSNIYSSRARSLMIELLTWDFNFAMIPYTPKWRAHRRMLHQHFHQGVVDLYRPVQLQKVRESLLNILKTPHETRDHVRTGSMRIVRKYLPFVSEMRGKLYEEVRTAVDNGTASASLATTLIQEVRTKYGGTEDESTYDEIAMDIASVLYSAASDSTISVAEIFLLAMALYPHAQMKGQAELDKVVGSHRLPDYDDLENLPYARAIGMETLRWMATGPIGIPHAVVADDVYKGYYIPKGAMIVANVWAMMNNPDEYPAPDVFRPERFLNEDGGINTGMRDPFTVVFGFGRRICPGRYFAMNTLSIFIATILQVFDVSAGVDEFGKPVELTAEPVGDAISLQVTRWLKHPINVFSHSKLCARERRQVDAALKNVLDGRPLSTLQSQAQSRGLGPIEPSDQKSRDLAPIMDPPLIIILTLLTAIVAWAWTRSKARYPLPPGPKGLPLLGNALQIPAQLPWKKYQKWSEDLNSDIISLSLPMRPTIILNSAKVTIDLLEKRSHLYSSRVRFVVIEMMSWNTNFALMPYGPFWRAHHRTLHQYFHQSAVHHYMPQQLEHTRKLLVNIMNSPQHIRKHIRQTITSTIFAVTYGKTVEDMDHEYVTGAGTAMQGLIHALVPGAYWVEYFPFLRHIPSWVPGTSAQKLAEKYRPYVEMARNKPFEEVRAAMKEDTATPSLVNKFLDEIQSKYGDTDEGRYHEIVARNAASVVYAGGTDTTVSSVEYFLLAMALHPDVQRKAQNELDRVVGQNRLPEFEDLENMPYLRAVVMESLRWFPVSPFGIPHAVVEDDTYEGYHIPKGATVIPNVWAMTRDVDDYPDPEAFKPERYLDPHGDISPAVRDPAPLIFGFGRRICPGRHFAVNSLSILAASVLHVFEITAGVDSSGDPIQLTTEVLGGIITFVAAPCSKRLQAEV
ncbi:hypothetical protein EIP91_001627 [Steccherinum ochraceum]|uniref:Cytochrome P450-dit2 n=1 Tax=Steccherinum ochraceum TaxID=92696 RepID=A0A4R0RUA0_9APHY|nr:hypothetical protein EIP91_001627 [Steccherinum ochraceum]